MAIAPAIRQPQRQPWPAPRGPGPIGRSVKLTSRQYRRCEANHAGAIGAKPSPNLVFATPRQRTEDTMPINYEQMMQSKATGLEARYGDREVMLYALGIGFQRDPMNEQELPFTYENDLQ